MSKHVNYKIDGSGRDSYIYQNNGGAYTSSRARIMGNPYVQAKSHNKSVPIQPKIK